MADDNMLELGSVIDFSEDLSTAEAPPPLPAGKYLATVSGAVIKISQKSGNKYADITYTIAPDQFPADFSAIQKEPLPLHYRRLVLSDDARGRYNSRKFSEVHRVPTGKRMDLNDFIGRPANLIIVESEYNGEKRPDIKTVEMA